MGFKENYEIEKLKRDIIKEEKRKEKEKLKKEKEKLEKIKKEDIEENKEVQKEKKEILKEKARIEKEHKEKEENAFKKAMSNFRRPLKDEKGYHVFSIIILVFCFVFSIVLIYMAANKLSNKVYKNVYLGSHYVGDLTGEELENKIVEIYKQENLKIIVTVKQGEKIIDTIVPEDIDLAIDIPETKKHVLEFGRDANIFTNNLNIFKALINKKVIDCSYKYNKEKLKEAIEIMQTNLDTRAVNDSFEQVEAKLLITRGKDGLKIDEEKMMASVDKIFSKPKNSEYQIETVEEKAVRLNVDEVYNKVYREPQDAAKVKNPDGTITFKREVVGYFFSKEKLKEEIAKMQDGQVLEFPLEVKMPKVKYEDIKWEEYKDVLGEMTTYFPAGIYARSINLRTALSVLNGVVIMPGETFSYNRVIGNPSYAKGYRPAATFKGGVVVNEIGGGICQTVSTLYNAALYANLPIVERHPHGLAVGYVKPSLDATMYNPVKDFKFKNNKNYPIKIVTSFSSKGVMNIKLMGTREANDVEVVLESKTLSTRKFGTTYVNDPTLPKGKQVVRSNGVIGYTSEAYKVTKKNGVVINRVRLSRDTYKPTNKIVAVGTK